MNVKFKSRYILLFLICSVVGLSNAQIFNVQKLQDEKGKSRGASFLGIDRDGFMYWSSTKTKNYILVKSSQPWVKVISPATGALISEGKMDQKRIRDMGYRYVSTLFLEDKLLMILRKNEGADEETSNYFGIEIDSDLTEKSHVFKIGEKPICKGFNSGKQKDFEQAVTYYRDPSGVTTFLSEVACEWDKHPSYVAITLDDNYNELAKQRFELPIENNSVEVQVVRYANSLVLNVKSMERVNIGKSAFGDLILVNRLFLIDSLGTVHSIPLDLAQDKVPAAITFEVTDEELRIYGQLIKRNSTELLGLFSASFDLLSQIVDVHSQMLFSDELAAKFLNDEKFKHLQKVYGRNYVTINYKLTHKFALSEGREAYLIQKKYVQHIARLVSAEDTYVKVNNNYFYYLDVMVVLCDNEGNVIWDRTVPVEHIAQFYDPGSAFVGVSNKDNIYLLYSSLRQQKETNVTGAKTKRKGKPSENLTVTTIDASGVMRSDDVMNLSDKRISFSTNRIAIDENNQRFIYMARPRKWFSSKNRFVVYSIGF